jgi:CheY-like chemotaxis protein
MAEAGEKNIRVLVAEDNIINQRIAMHILQKLGYKVDLAGNGKEALEAIERAHYSLVLMDLQMPQMDGFEATAAIRRRESAGGRRIPIVALTAHAMKGDRERCMEAGMDDYIAKPFSAGGLARVIDRLLSQPIASVRE